MLTVLRTTTSSEAIADVCAVEPAFLAAVLNGLADCAPDDLDRYAARVSSGLTADGLVLLAAIADARDAGAP